MNNKSDKSNYWNNFYSSLEKIAILKNLPSLLFSVPNMQKKNNFNFILYVACRNGRDSVFFLKNKIITFSLDRSEEAFKETIKKCHVYEDFIYQISDIVNQFHNFQFDKIYQSKENFLFKIFLHTLRDEEVRLL